MSSPNIFAKVRGSLARDRELSLASRLRKGARYVAATALAKIYLRGCNSVGARARTIGRPRVENAGRIDVGADLVMSSEFSPVELVALASGTLLIGDGVHVNYGTSIRAAERVTLGDGVSVGPYCIIDDGADADVRPIEIGAGVWLAGRVTVLPGSRIGEGSVITAGSIVSGDIPPGVVAGGVPARVLRSITSPGEAFVHDPSASTEVADSRIDAEPSVGPPPGTPALAGVVLADFTIGDLAVRLLDARDGPVMVVVDAPFCQTAQRLLTLPPSDAADFAVIWTRPEIAVPSFGRLLAGELVSEADLEREADAFAALVQQGANGYRFVFVPTWTVPAHDRGFGLLDARPGGETWALALINGRLMKQLAHVSNTYVLNAQRWLEASARGRSTAKGWYLGKVPFSAELFAEAARDIKAAVRALSGHARKLLVLDLDDTLWGGIVGDVGWEQLQLGGHDGIGEAFVDFQKAVRVLARRGVVLGIVSKNTEEVALEAMRQHPQMVLRPADFVGWRINWNDKAQNVADLAAELNLGLQSVVFIDDNPVERARVREALPEVLVPDWPEDKLLYTEALHALRCFDSPARSEEDAARTAMYAVERERGAMRTKVGSLDDWLRDLGIVVRVDRLDMANLGRCTQLLNKTNQMNLRTRRLSEPELLAWSQQPGCTVWAMTVSDRLGSAGLTGLLSLESAAGSCHIVDFVLSCRVMGRRVEDAMLHVAVRWAREHGLREVLASYQMTPKNRPCLDFWTGSPCERDDAGTEFSWNADREYPLPASLSLDWPAAGAPVGATFTAPAVGA